MKSRSLTTAFLSLLLFTACTQLKRCAYEGVDRDRWQKPDEVIRSLSLGPGDLVADVGSGSGYFTFRLARAVGPSGRVYAVDIDKGLNELVAERARKEGYQNVRVVLARPDDPLLPEPVDLIFLSNTYHHLQHRAAYFARAKKYLRPDGRVAIVEFKEGGWLAPLGSHGTPAQDIKRDLAAAGYRLEKELDFLPKQHFLIFRAVNP